MEPDVSNNLEALLYFSGFTERLVEVIFFPNMLPWEDSICILTYCLKAKETDHPITKDQQQEGAGEEVGGTVVVNALTSFCSRKIQIL